MKASARKPFLIVFATALALTLGATVFRAVLLFTSFDASLGYFAEGAAADLLLPLLFVIAAVLYACYGFLSRADLHECERRTTVAVIFASAFATVSVAVWFITSLPLIFSAPTPIAGIFALLMLLASLGLGGYFVLCALAEGSKTLRTAFGICAVLFCVFYILYTYFDTALVLNSPIKIFDQLTYVVFTLFFILECRCQFGTAHGALYLPVTLLAMTFAAANAVPALLYAAAKHATLSGGIMHDFMTFAILLYAASRLFSLAKKTEEEDVRGVYAADIEESAKNGYLPDADTHVVTYDPDQQSFDFDTEDEEEEKEKAHKEPISEKNDGDDTADAEDSEEEYGVAQTTLDFKRHS